jgi:hypothetical protein
MRRRPVARALVGALVAALVAACGGGSDDGGAEPASSPSSDATASDSPTASTGPAAGGDPAAYLPAPQGVELTAPGTALRLRDSAYVAWTPRQDLVGVVGLKVLEVRRTTVAESLQGFRLDPTEAASTPYFVSTVVGNGGDTDLGGRQLPIYAVDSEDRLVPPTGVDRAFEPCPGSVLPPIFAPGDTARSCLIFLVPAGAELVSVMFRPPEGVVPITWTGRIRDIAEGAKGATGRTGKKPAAG